VFFNKNFNDLFLKVKSLFGISKVHHTEKAIQEKRVRISSFKWKCSTIQRVLSLIYFFREAVGADADIQII
jgi:hypothetical protein